MNLSHSLDAKIAIAIATVFSLIAVAAGFHKLIGTFLILPTVFVVAGALLRASPLFLTGSSLALSTTNFLYIASLTSNSDTNSSGFVVMFLVISTGIGLLGAIVASLLLRRFVFKGPTLALIIGFAGITIGFFGSQLVICNSMLYCGSLLIPFK
jgi:hypothetical protein